MPHRVFPGTVTGEKHESIGDASSLADGLVRDLDRAFVDVGGAFDLLDDVDGDLFGRLKSVECAPVLGRVAQGIRGKMHAAVGGNRERPDSVERGDLPEIMSRENLAIEREQGREDILRLEAALLQAIQQELMERWGWGWGWVHGRFCQSLPAFMEE